MRRLALVPLAALFLIPATASAVTTAVTAPATGTRLLVDPASPPTVHFAGTADVPAVDLLCVSSSAGFVTIGTIPIKTNVDSSSGSFSTDATWPTNAALCEVFAVAHGTVPTTNTDLNGLSGSKVYVGYKGAPEVTAGKAYDYYAYGFGPDGEYDFDSFGDCTVDFGQLVQMHEYDGSIFDCNGYTQRTDPTVPAPAPSIVVDQHSAFPTFFIGSQGALSGLPGWTGLTYDFTDDAGSWHLTSHEGIFRCQNTDDAQASGCTGFVSTGVGLNVDEKLSPDGRTLVQKLDFASEDNQQHTLSAVLNQTTVDARQWFFPGTGGYAPFGATDVVATVAPAVATIRNRIGTGTPDPDITRGFGAITYAVTPAGEQFWDPGDAFAQRYTNLTIPAGKTTRLEFIYNMNAGSAGLDGQVGAAESSIGAPPAIAVTSPATTTAAAYTLSGKVTAPEMLNAFTVNDQSVAVAGDGTFSAPETLTTGANSFTLKATDELGRTTTTAFGVTLTPPPPAPLGVRFRNASKPKLKGRLLTTGETATCPGNGPACSITALALAGRKTAGKGSASVKAGATAPIKLTLTKPELKLLKRKHKLKLTLKFTGKRSGAATATAQRTITLTLKRKR